METYPARFVALGDPGLETFLVEWKPRPGEVRSAEWTALKPS